MVDGIHLNFRIPLSLLLSTDVDDGVGTVRQVITLDCYHLRLALGNTPGHE